jgi:xanthine dehydrogenase molybdopterin-binding subunit B
MDPLEFRLKNLVGSSDEIFNPLPEIIPQLRTSSDYDGRKAEIEEFNKVTLSFFLLILLTAEALHSRVGSWPYPQTLD